VGVHPYLPAPGHRRRPSAPRGEDTLSSVRVRPGCLAQISGRCPCSPADASRCAAHRLRGEQAVTDSPAPPGVRRRTMRIRRILGGRSRVCVWGSRAERVYTVGRSMRRRATGFWPAAWRRRCAWEAATAWRTAMCGRTATRQRRVLVTLLESQARPTQAGEARRGHGRVGEETRECMVEAPDAGAGSMEEARA
jgi:hypothetical protein